MKLLGIMILITLTALAGCRGNKEDLDTTFQVTFHETILDSIKITEGERLESLPMPEREGYVFIGWYLDEGLTEQFDATELIMSDVVLYARWASEETGLVLSYEFLDEKLLVHLNLDETLTLNGYDLRVHYDALALTLNQVKDNLGHVYNDTIEGLVIINYSNVMASMPEGKLLTLEFSKVHQGDLSTIISVDVIESYYVSEQWEIVPIELEINPVLVR